MMPLKKSIYGFVKRTLVSVSDILQRHSLVEMYTLSHIVNIIVSFFLLILFKI